MVRHDPEVLFRSRRLSDTTIYTHHPISQTFPGQMLPLKQLSKLCLTDDSPSVSYFQGRSSSSSALSFYASLPSLGGRWCPWCRYYRRLDGYYMPCRVIQTGAHLMIRKTTTTTSLCVSRRREKCLVTMSLTVNDTLRWLSSLPLLIMEESFWW